MRKWTLLLPLLLLLAVAACGASSEPAGAGDPAAGENVFLVVAVPSCSSCHSLEPGRNMLGPSLAGIGGKTAAEIREDIVDPNAEVEQGYVANVMPADYGQRLTEQQLNDLIAYLQTLE